MPTVNTGILAHVDAGKTSLTERLLFRAGVIGELGSVDAGNTQTDSMAIERQRGITIRSAVVALTIADRTVNLIDTPGHSDFIAEVERSLGVLDGVVLVVSAVEGVQAQTRVLMRTLRALRLPVLIFVNKIDRLGARADELLAEIRRTIAPSAVAMSNVLDLGTKNARIVARDLSGLAELLAENDDAFLARYLDETITEAELRAEFVAQVRRAQVRPVFFGSAMTGVGVDELLDGIATLLPATEPSEGEPVGVVFKIDRSRAGEKISYLRMFAGSIGAREPLVLHRSGFDYAVRPTSVGVFDRGTHRVARRAVAGDIAVVTGLAQARIGDRLGPADRLDEAPHFPPPSLETAVTPVRAADGGRLFAALTELAEQDPFIDVRQDGELSVRLYGEVQKEVLRARLADDYGVDAEFAPSQLVYLEKPIGTGAAVEEMGRSEPVYFFATVGLRVEPGEPDSGVVFRLAVELGSLPLAFHKAIEETVLATLAQGLYGWEVTDIVVTLVQTGFDSVFSTAGDFRKLTPLVLMNALAQAGTVVHEPVQRFELDIPVAALSPVLVLLAEARARLREPELTGESCRLRGELPAARMPEVERALPGLTQGESVFAARPCGYQPISGAPPRRERRDGNPLDRDEYLLRVLKHL
ncbi:MAG TPA: translation factor GTPase family protein [Pseudonocardiaceae bacterium]|nr:translation factor GTPase family protein [Pseudonocardiaceae bacterium]